MTHFALIDLEVTMMADTWQPKNGTQSLISLQGSRTQYIYFDDLLLSTANVAGGEADTLGATAGDDWVHLLYQPYLQAALLHGLLHYSN